MFKIQFDNDIENHIDEKIINEIVDNFQNYGRLIWDVKINVYNKSMIIPLVFIHETGLFVFTSYSDEQMFKKQAIEIYRWFQKKYYIDLNVMYVIGIDSARQCVDEQKQIQGHCYHMVRQIIREVNLIDFLREYLEYEYHVIDHQFIDGIEMEMLKDVKGVKSIQGLDGNRYVLKKGHWYQCLDLDADEFFEWMVFGGCLGTHRFMLGQRMSGIVYVLTYGMFGIGWFFDCLSVLLGVYKCKGKSKVLKSIRIRLKNMNGYVEDNDDENHEIYYLDALTDLKRKWLVFAVMTGIHGGLAYGYVWLFNHN